MFDEPPNEKVDEPAGDESESEMTLPLNIRTDARAMMRFPIKKWQPMLIKLVSNGSNQRAFDFSFDTFTNPCFMSCLKNRFN